MVNQTSFGQILRERRTQLGLTQAELARRAGCAPITVRKMEGDALRPSVQLALLLAKALNISDAEQAGFVQLARQEQSPTPIPAPIITPQQIAALVNPYQGLRPFAEADADKFCGRDRMIEALLVRMSDGSDAERFLAVVGPSGSGKSSLVNAGLLPKVRQGKLPGSKNWFIVNISPGAKPWEELASALQRMAPKPMSSLLADLQQDERGLLDAVQGCLPVDDETELLLVIDQFEELFTLVEDEEVRERFLQGLVTAVLNPHSRLRVVITLRADFTDRPLQYRAFGELMQQRIAFVLPLTPDELAQAITIPIENLGLKMVPELIATIIQEVVTQPGMLPLLQYALTELFEQREGPIITLQMYRQTGGVTGALSRRADEIFHRLSETAQEAARQLFLRLINLGEGAEDTRRRVPLSELESLPNQFEHSPIAEYSKYRLLTFDHDPVTGGPTVELAHEALLLEWPRLRKWLHEIREDVRRQRLLWQAAQQWRANANDASYLLRGNRLISFEDWAESTTVSLTAQEQHYLQSSITNRDIRHAAEKARRQHELEAAQRLAREQKVQANLAISRELALAAINNFTVDPERSILLACEALKTVYTRSAEEALRQSLQLHRLQLRFKGHGEAGAWNVLFHPNGKQAASLGGNDEGYIWDTISGEIVVKLPVKGQAIKFTPDGALLAIADDIGQITFTDCQNGNKVLVLQITEGKIIDIDISPDGSLLVVGTESGELIVWQFKENSELYRLQATEGDLICKVAFSPDGSQIAATGWPSIIKLWRSQTGEELLRFGLTLDFPQAFAFSPAGKRLYTVIVGAGASKNDIYIWDISEKSVSAGEPEIILRGMHTNVIMDIAFNVDGSQFVTTGLDSMVKIWDTNDPLSGPILTLSGHDGGGKFATFSPDGCSVLSSAKDAARIWDVTVAGSGEVQNWKGNDIYIRALAYHPQGINISSAGSDAFVHIWDSGTGTLQHTLGGHERDVWAVTYNPNGTILASGGADKLIRIWESDCGTLLQTLEGHGPGSIGGIFEGILALDFNADGSLLASAGADGTVRIWEVENWEQVHNFMPHPDGIGVTNVKFSPDGRQLAATTDVVPQATILDLSDKSTAVIDKNFNSARIWAVGYSPDGKYIAVGESTGRLSLYHAETLELAFELSGHVSMIWASALDFSPDSSLLVSGSSDGVVRIWDIEAQQLHLELPTHPGSVYAVKFSPDGQQIVTAGSDLIIRTFTLDLKKVLEIAGHRVTRRLTQEECQQYLHLSTCPE